MSTDFEIGNEDGKVTLIKYTGKEANVIIPDGIEVIGNTAFYGLDTLISVKIPRCVNQIIGDWNYLYNGAFNGCKNLRTVTFSDGLEKIGARSFLGCNSLTSIEIPGSVNWIGGDAFSGCTYLGFVTIKDPFYTPGYQELDQSKREQNADAIPNLEIGDFAFSGCEKLESLTISQNLKSIGRLAIPTQAHIYLHVQYGSHLSQNIPQIGYMHLNLHNSSGDLMGVLYVPGYRPDDPHMRFLTHFSEGKIKHLSEYDCLFSQSDAVVLHKCRAAITRLQYPLELEDKSRNQYSAYLVKNVHMIIPQLLASDDIAALSMLSTIGAIPPDRIDDYLEQTKEFSNIETRAILLDYKNSCGIQVSSKFRVRRKTVRAGPMGILCQPGQHVDHHKV